MHSSKVVSSSVLALSIELFGEAAWADNEVHHHATEVEAFGVSNLAVAPYRVNHDGMFQPQQEAHYPSLGEAQEHPPNVKFFSVQGLSWGVTQNALWHSQDRASLRLSAPMPEARTALSLAGTLLQNQPDEQWVNGAQALSLLLKRQVKAEFNYSAPLAQHSRFDSSITCKISPDSKPALTASVRYSMKF